MENKTNDLYESYNPGEIRRYCTKLLHESHVDIASNFSLAHKLTLLDAEMKSSNYKQRNFMAENMFGNMVGLLYDNYPEMMEVDKEDRPYLRLANDVRIYPKKLSEKYLPSNIITDHVRKLGGQKLSDEGTQIHVLYAGFVLTDKIWPNEVKGYYVSYVNDANLSKVAWVLDLDEFRKNKIIELPIHIQQIDERLVAAKRNLPPTAETGI